MDTPFGAVEEKGSGQNPDATRLQKGRQKPRGERYPVSTVRLHVKNLQFSLFDHPASDFELGLLV